MRREAKLFLDTLPAKATINLTEMWQALATAFPGLAGSADLRSHLAGLVDELAEKGVFSLPKGKKGYDYGGNIRLPLSVKRSDMRQKKERLGTRIWSPELVFLAGETLPPDTPWLAMDAWLKSTSGQLQSPCPVRERSLEIFGDDKTLDRLAKTRPFIDGRITLAALGCYQVPMPLAARFESGAPPLALVVENLATYDSIARANKIHRRYRAVVFGNGNAFATGWEDLLRLKAEFGIERCLYFGDLDGLGLSIPFRVANVAGEEFLELATDLYLAMIDGRTDGWRDDGSRLDAGAEEWARKKLPGADEALSRVAAGERLPQEWLTRYWLEKNL